MNVEDRLKAALHGTADLVEDRPRPLPAAPRRRGLPRLMPVWAALIVALVLLGPFVLPDGEPGTPVPLSSPSIDIGSAPKFYVAVYRAAKDRQSRFEIRSTATGELLDVNYAGGKEDFVSIASVPDDGRKEVSSFYLLARVDGGTRPGCAKYTVYDLQISAENGFSSWGGNAIWFEALDGTPANLATTPKGDEIAYSYESCGQKVVEENTVSYIGDGVFGTPMIAHHWAGTTTVWGSEGKVLNLAYSPDGHSLAVFRRRDAEGGRKPQSELLFMRTADPSDTTSLLTGSASELLDPAGGHRLSNAMISPDGKEIIAVFGRQNGSGTELSAAEFPVGGGDPRVMDPLEPAIDHPLDGPVSLEQHPSGPELLLQAGDTTIFQGGQVKARIPSTEGTPADISW